MVGIKKDLELVLTKGDTIDMVKSIRDVEKALGKLSYELSEKVEKNRVFVRSLFVVKDIKAGEPFTEENIRSIRPGYGMHPKYFNEILGKKAKVDIKRGTPLKEEYIEKGNE